MPAERVTVQRIRIRDSVGYVRWISKTPWPKANKRNVLKPYSKDIISLNQKGVTTATPPSGLNIKSSFDMIATCDVRYVITKDLTL